MALSSPKAILRDRDGQALPRRRPCLKCSKLISAYAPASDRFCFACAPHVDDEPPRDPALYCPHGHLRVDCEVTRVDRSRPSRVKTECRIYKAERNAKRDRSAAAIAARELERERRTA